MSAGHATMPFCPLQLPKMLLKSKAPNIIVLSTMAFDILEGAREVKRIADELFCAGFNGSAIKRYEGLVESIHGHLLFKIPMDELIQDTVCTNYRQQLATVVADAAVSAAYAGVRDCGRRGIHGYISWEFGSVVSMISALPVEHQLRYSEAFREKISVPFRHARFCSYHLTLLLNTGDASTLDDLQSLLTDMLRRAPGDEYVSHDLGLVNEIKADIGILSHGTVEESIAMMSVHVLPPRTYNTPPPLNAAPPPQSRNWVPLALTTEEKRAMHALQDEHGLPMSTFEDISESTAD